MFKLLGSDGKEYGPVTTEQLRQWIREGRAGGQTRVKPEGAGDWMLLNTVPEFADVFRAPPPADYGASGPMPPVVRIVAFTLFAVAAVSAMRLLMFFIPLMLQPGSRASNFGLLYFLSWGVGLISVPARIACGIGLLFRKEWARLLTIVLSILLAISGAWGLAQTGKWLVNTSDPSFLLRSPMFLVGQLWSLVLFLFNIATVVILTRKPVRDAFAKKSSVAV